MPGWKVDDKAWMKQRREEWKQVKKCVDQLTFFKACYKKAMKKFFLTGDGSDPQYPLKEVEAAPLFEIWFDPDKTEENWNRIREKYRYKLISNVLIDGKATLVEEIDESKWGGAIYRFYEIARGIGYDMYYRPEYNNSFFGGIEKRLFEYWYPKELRFRREDYPHMSDEEFDNEHFGTIRLTATFDILFRQDNPNPHNIDLLMVNRWHEALLMGYKDRPEFGWVLAWVDTIMANPKQFHEVKVKLARELNDVFDDPNLPREARDKILEIRAHPDHPTIEP